MMENNAVLEITPLELHSTHDKNTDRGKQVLFRSVK